MREKASKTMNTQGAERTVSSGPDRLCMHRKDVGSRRVAQATKRKRDAQGDERRSRGTLDSGILGIVRFYQNVPRLVHVMKRIEQT